MPKMRQIFAVYPRYTGGSPAQVDEQTALHVAKSEQQMHALGNALENFVDPALMVLGLSGIVISWREIGKRVEVMDLITGDHHDFAKMADFRTWTESLRKPEYKSATIGA